MCHESGENPCKSMRSTMAILKSAFGEHCIDRSFTGDISFQGAWIVSGCRFSGAVSFDHPDTAFISCQFYGDLPQGTPDCPDAWFYRCIVRDAKTGCWSLVGSMGFP